MRELRGLVVRGHVHDLVNGLEVAFVRANRFRQGLEGDDAFSQPWALGDVLGEVA